MQKQEAGPKRPGTALTGKSSDCANNISNLLSSKQPSVGPLVVRSLGSIGEELIILTWDGGSFINAIKTSHPAAAGIQWEPVRGKAFFSAKGDQLKCAGRAEVLMSIAPGVQRTLTLYALDELFVPMLLGAPPLYEGPASYDVNCPDPFWQLGDDRCRVFTDLADAATMVHSIRMLSVDEQPEETPVLSVGAPSLTKQQTIKAKRKESKLKRTQAKRGQPVEPPPPPKEPRAMRQPEEPIPDDPFAYKPTPALPFLNDLDPGRDSIFAALKIFDDAEKKPHLIQTKTGEVNCQYDPALPPKVREMYWQLNNIEFRDVFANSDAEIGRTGSCEFRIFTTDPQPDISGQKRKLPFFARTLAEAEVENMWARGWIKFSESPWSAPIVMVRQGEKWRFCLDFKGLNAKTVDDGSPVPNLMESLYKLQGCKVFSQLDVARFYHQVPLAAESAPKTAFSLGHKHYEYTAVPFGLKNAPAALVRFMSGHVLSDLEKAAISVYVDDVHSGSADHEAQIALLRQVYTRLRAHGLVLRAEKCLFGAQSVRALGYVVDKDGIRPDGSKLDAIRHFPLPATPKALRSFLGLINFNGFFVRLLQDVLRPLNAATSQSPQSFKLSAECVKAFHRAKQMFMDELLLKLPDFQSPRPFVLITDGSETAIGSILAQHDAEGMLWPLAFFSRSLTEAQCKYAARHLEQFSLVEGCKHFHNFLAIRPFVWMTDHKPLEHAERNPRSQVIRWNRALEEYTFETVYIPGPENAAADALSRYASAPEVVQINALRAIVEAMPRAYVSKDAVAEVLAKHHDERNHQSWKQMLQAMRPLYFWPTMVADIKRKALDCDVCQRCQRPHGETPPETETDTPSGPWQSVCADLCDITDRDGQLLGKMLLVADRFTRFIEAELITNKEAETVEAALTRILFQRHGFPGADLLTDGGTEFNFLAAYSEKAGFYWRRTSRGNPRSNGQAERGNQTILQLLKKRMLANEIVKHLVQERDRLPGSPLEKALAAALWTYNNTAHSSTGMTPFKLCHLRDPTIPVEVLDQKPFRRVNTKTSMHADFQQRAAELAALHAKTREAEIAAKQRRAEHARKNSKFAPFAVGDLVMITPESGGKLAPLSEPYKVVQVKQGHIYALEKEGDFKDRIHAIAHDKLIPYRRPDPALQTPALEIIPAAKKKRGRPRKQRPAQSPDMGAPYGSGGIPPAEQQPESWKPDVTESPLQYQEAATGPDTARAPVEQTAPAMEQAEEITDQQNDLPMEELIAEEPPLADQPHSPREPRSWTFEVPQPTSPTAWREPDTPPRRSVSPRKRGRGWETPPSELVDRSPGKTTREARDRGRDDPIYRMYSQWPQDAEGVL